MTCIVGVLPGDGSVWMGADSYASWSNEGENIAFPKVFQKDSVLYGISGRLWVAQQLCHVWKIPTIGLQDDLLIWMVKEMRPSLMAFYASNEILVEDWPQIMVGSRGKLFSWYTQGSASETLYGYEAIGCGGVIAKGSLYTTNKMKSAQRRITLALEAAERHSNAVRGPFTILHLEGENQK